jgi:hypothetical protein
VSPPRPISPFGALAPTRTHALVGSDLEERRRLKTEVLSAECTFDVVVTTYDMAKSDDMQATLLSRRWWQYVVLDEVCAREATERANQRATDPARRASARVRRAARPPSRRARASPSAPTRATRPAQTRHRRARLGTPLTARSHPSAAARLRPPASVRPPYEGPHY